jgi:TatD DNase family protein
VPYRGKRNEPAWVAHTLAKLAIVRGDDPQELGRATAANAGCLFGLAFQAA